MNSFYQITYRAKRSGTGTLRATTLYTHSLQVTHFYNISVAVGCYFRFYYLSKRLIVKDVFDDALDVMLIQREAKGLR